MPKLILETLFSSNLRVKILKFLFRNAAGSFSLKELSDHVQEHPQAVKKEIASLMDIGLIKNKR